MYVTKDLNVELVVTFICFIEAWDLLFQHFENKRNEKKDIKSKSKVLHSILDEIAKQEGYYLRLRKKK